MRWLGYLWRIAANLFYMLVVFAVLIGIRDPMEKSIISVLGIIYTTVRSETPPSLTLRRSLVRVWFARSRGRPIGGNACARDRSPAVQRIFKFSAESLPRFATTSKLTFAPSAKPV
jgi:hypothetical protein